MTFSLPLPPFLSFDEEEPSSLELEDLSCCIVRGELMFLKVVFFSNVRLVLFLPLLITKFDSLRLGLSLVFGLESILPPEPLVISGLLLGGLGLL